MQTAFLASLIAAVVATAMAPLAPQQNSKLPPERLAQIAAAQID